VKCGSNNLIPLDSPIGQKLLADQGKTLEQALSEKTLPRIYTNGEKIMICVVIVVVISLIILFNNV